MNCFWGHYNIDGKPVLDKVVEEINRVSSWWNPDDIFTIKRGGLALSNLTSKLNGSTANKSADQHASILTIEECTITGDIRLDNKNELSKSLGVETGKYNAYELLIHLYLRDGLDFVKQLRGAFAFCIFDNKKNQLFCTRDQIGVKPLNYYFNEKDFIFASHRKSILSLDSIDKKVDWHYIVSRLNRKMAVDNRTENKNIKKLLPAHYLILKDGQLKTHRYWDFDIQTEIKYKDDKSYVDHFLNLFKKSISHRVSGSTNIGAHLSGGLDSSGITGVTASLLKETNKNFHSFSYVVPPPEYGHFPEKLYNYNHLVEKQNEFSNIKFPHLLSTAGLPNFKKRVENEVLVSDGYSWSNNANTEYELQVEAEESQIGIMFSGFLGDEIITSFCRPYYLDYLARGQYIDFFKSKHRGQKQFSKNMLLLGLHMLKSFKIPINDNYWASIYQKKKDEKLYKNKVSLLKSNYFHADIISNNSDLQDALHDTSRPEVHEKIPLTLKEYQRNHITRNWTNRRMEAENMAALNFGLEYRYPMADLDMLQYVLSLPMEQKWNPEMNRYLYRRAMKQYVHDDIRLGSKYSSALKPSALYVKTKKDLSDVEFWENAKSENAVFFLDQEKIAADLKHRRAQGKFYKYAILSEMVMSKKITI